MTKPLEGVYVALTTPFAGDRIAPDKLRENVGRLNSTAVAGFLVLGSTGESVSLTDAESLALVEAVLDAAAPDKKVLVGTAREWTKGTIDFTAGLPARGVAAVLVRPPSYFRAKMTREALRAHYLAVADASPLPVVIYNMPALTGLSLEPGLVVDLAGHPNIIGLKESSGSIGYLEEVVRRVPGDFHYFVGSGHVVFPGLEMGASGAILAVANAAPELAAEIFRQYKTGHKDRARELQLDLVPLNKALTETYGIAGLKHAQDLRGFWGGPPRPPLLPVDDAASAEIAAILRRLGLLTS
ncbi:MAG TPA: dihydrodipicolinate synthase family protein [Candidatus Aminicenantes bacterium]|nr:dihydrodipicolinate synthase family protein [Candidatus Aminicenantes bacterium]HRY65385.1 dihydrodipicolinate synthase family protein [Candidatus Aminicenantes bacterium]HRZ72147.1 dihydrodipicolinate synthase family protein [Candidatus Aminicenantes bacterium]